MTESARAEQPRLAFVVDTNESTEDPGVGRFYRGLVGALRKSGLEVATVGLREGASVQLETLSGRLAGGRPRRGARLAIARQTAADLRELARWSTRPLPDDRFDAVLEFQYPGRFRGWRLAHRDHARHLVFVDQVESLIPPRPSVTGPALRRLERARFTRADAVVFRTGTLGRAYINRWGDPRCALVSHMAVDPGEFTACDDRRERVRRELGISADEIVVGAVAFFAPYHRPELIGPLIAGLRAEGAQARGLLVGGWANESAAVLERARQDSPEAWDHVLVVGAVPQAAVPGLIDAMDIGVMPGSNWYGSPTKVLEYGAMRTPVVAPRMDPICEVVRDEEGALFGDGEFVSTVRDVIAQPAVTAARVEAFHIRVLREHTWEARARDLAALV